jgi:antitoxin component YwqK of YwqJK toxin-antitoxin module
MGNIKPSLDYYWYANNLIQKQQGGISGKVLNGEYEERYPNKKLLTQGRFLNGLKDGVWENWYDNGRLANIITWKKGIRSGSFSDYNMNGIEIRSGRYKDNLIEGKVTINPMTDSVRNVKYKHGAIISDRSHSIFNRLNIFKRRKKNNGKIDSQK